MGRLTFADDVRTRATPGPDFPPDFPTQALVETGRSRHGATNRSSPVRSPSDWRPRRGGRIIAPGLDRPAADHGFLHQTFARPSRASIVGTAREYYTMAFMLSPAVAFAAWRRLRWRLSWATITAIAVVALGAAIDRHYGSLFTGNYLDRQGIANTQVLGGARPTLLPGPLWDLLIVIGLVSGGLLAGIAVTVDRHALRRWRSWAWGTPIGAMWVFGALFAIGLAVYGLLSVGLYDRYLWPLIFRARSSAPPLQPASAAQGVDPTRGRDRGGIVRAAHFGNGSTDRQRRYIQRWPLARRADRSVPWGTSESG